MDNSLVAAWFIGRAAVKQQAYHKRVYAAIDVLQALVRFEGWNLRWPQADWVKWVPRERNVIADSLANLCLDRGQDILVRGQLPNMLCTNFVMVSDGACRSSVQKSAASWCVLAFHHGSISIVGGGGVFLPSGTSSLDAELAGLELAIGALLKCSRGYTDIAPHGANVILQSSEFLESNGHWLTQPV